MADKKTITELTPEQEGLLDVYAKRWIEIGLDTAPADRKRTEAEIRKLYVQEGLTPPAFEWHGSPIAAVRVMEAAGVDNPLRAAVYGQHTAGWCGYLSYLREVLEFEEETQDALPHIEIAKCCGWWFAFDKTVVCTERPCLINRDAEGNLHCENGPALQYPDGESIYAVHGVLVPSSVIEKRDEITLEAVIEEKNVEIRRVMTDLAPWEKLVSDVEVLDEDKDLILMPRRLLKVEVPDDEDIILVEVRDSTEGPNGRKRYYLRVPPETTTCAEAVAWTFDMPVGDYQPLIET